MKTFMYRYLVTYQMLSQQPHHLPMSPEDAFVWESETRIKDESLVEEARKKLHEKYTGFDFKINKITVYRITTTVEVKINCES